MSITTRMAGAIALAALLTGGIVTGVAVHAQDVSRARGGQFFGGPGGPDRGMHLLREMGLRSLDLTDAQEEQVRTVVQSHRAEFAQIRERLRAAHKGLNDAVTAATLDEAAIRARSADVAAVQADSAVLRAKVRGEVWSLLTPEQQQKATELRAKMAERFQQRLEQRRKQ
jgi:periplasmic protein CpxP/Spy